MSDIEIPKDTGDFRIIDRKVADVFKKMTERNRFVRGMMSWAHGKFRETLKSMCDKKGKVMINPSESYTSKTCSSCGWIDEKLDGKKNLPML